MIVICKKLGIYFDGKVVESCEDDFEVEEYTIFTCPSLYHKVKDKVEDYKILDLRILKAFRNPNEVAKALLTAESVYNELEFEAVNVGNSVAYIGDNLELIKELSLHCDLTVITQNEDTIRELYPYEVKVIRGRVKGVEGSIGNFKVYVEGYDVVRGKEVDFIEVGQVIYPNFDKHVEGIYGDEFLGAFKVLSNLGGFMKLVAVKVNHDICGVMKSGISGCNFCLECPNSAIEIVNGKINVDTVLCKACGFCSSICFTSAIENKVTPHDKLLEKVDKVSEVTDLDTIIFTCERSLGELYEFKNLPDVAIITVPCLNHVNEVHYLYAVLKGFKVLAIPCKDCEYFKTDCFDIAVKTLKAFGFNCLKLTRWEDFKDTFNELKKAGVPEVKFELRGRNKREMWLSLVESLMVYDLKERIFESKHFGKIKINDNCTLCNACMNFCPMEAIKKEDGKILFNHALCIACEMCAKACPEKAIEVEKALDFGDLGEKVVFEDEIIKCPKCGKPHISKRAYEKMKALTGMEKSLLFCKECRPKIIIEGVYEEIVKDIEEIRRRRLGE
ncbi:4Fe-4S binding protein [Archaeoglobus profundus]|uniref:4Fe-4S ferredoxin iron-sulfur binding domain protein n=1 Tax=Archaeoglobus profundus (strain DSM 5631 / JCM 9629 / NBRC 100127 / Av18) TaxID=572546 RepID=D2RHG2_ARCPA|nr:4Fe-4S binding protein [Archaeoglobus profundus]ADB57737.1 4Fe-4S ferredoxin iron-sulfur binding domain protein [Archaeoglobus profundus DSM 5631]